MTHNPTPGALSASHGLFLHCRPGFEAECAAEIQACAADLGVHGYCKAKPDAAYVVFVCPGAADAERLTAKLRWEQLIFARQWFRLRGLCQPLDVQDRVSGLVAALADAPAAAALMLESVDTNAGKALLPLCRKLQRPLTTALEQVGHLQTRAQTLRTHVCFLSTQAAYVGQIECANSSTQPLGIPRLKFPRGAPSRSTLKLDEALLSFLDTKTRAQLLQPGMTAVDLGAAPGGWSWQLVARGLHVIAVDNAAMDAALLESGRVEHQRADGFRFRPVQPVDWMVCDMVEQPARIAALAAQWLSRGDCRNCIFNLKLPMKKRYAEVQNCLQRLHEELHAAGRRYRLSCKQLYHDREEVTVCVLVQ